jgi:hypothetical protein
MDTNMHVAPENDPFIPDKLEIPVSLDAIRKEVAEETTHRACFLGDSEDCVV